MTRFGLVRTISPYVDVCLSASKDSLPCLLCHRIQTDVAEPVCCQLMGAREVGGNSDSETLYLM